MDDDILEDAREAFKLADEAESDNREAALDDLKFARLGEQWPDAIKEERERDRRPCLTINKLPAFRRQVVNDARQNKPSIQVHPADSKADPETAEIMSGLIRNIEYTSNAEVAYDTALESAVDGGFGYFRIGLDYAHEDAFDMDLLIQRVSNPFTIYGDPRSTAADSSDWNSAFVVEVLSQKEFETKYKGADPVDWDGDAYQHLEQPWMESDRVMVAEWWQRESVPKIIVQLADGTIIDEKVYLAQKDLFDLAGIQVTGTRNVNAHKVTQRILTGAEVLETNDWAGRYIPIVPVYGEEFNVEGKRHFRSLIRDAKDPQRMFNYWRTASTELVALAPRVPYVAPRGSFSTDAAKWQTINSKNWPYVEYDPVPGQPPPMRQPLDSGTALGAMNEALAASDDMKAIMGMYDASLGQKSNEVSGRAILARQREGDVSTFNFIDNLARGIRHAGRILIDLIPHVYTGQRIIRVMGEDGTPENVPLNQQYQKKRGGPIHVYDLAAGKYDLTVTAGPSFTTRREESANQMIEMMKMNPAVGPIIGDLVAKNLDWPGADEIAKRLKAMLPPQILATMEGDDIPPEAQAMVAGLKQQLQQAQQFIQQGMQRVQAIEQENQSLKLQNQNKQGELQLKAAELQMKGQESQADTQREQIKAMAQVQVAEIERDKDERIAGIEASVQMMADRMQMLNEQMEAPDEVTPMLQAQMQEMADMLAQSIAALSGKIDATQPVSIRPIRDASGILVGGVRVLADGTEAPIQLQ